MQVCGQSDAPSRILITGGAGFIGSHLAEALLERGCRVSVIDDLSTGSFQNIEHLTGNPRFRFTRDTILNETVLDRLAGECDAIYHLAATVGVKLTLDDPIHALENNVIGTSCVLRAAARHRTRLLFASTSEVYGKGSAVPFREDDDVVIGSTSRRRWGYASSKMYDEFLALAYHCERGLPVVIFRLFNVVGPRQTGRYGMVVPRFVSRALRGEPLEVYGDGRQSRCFLHVSDAVEAIAALGECRRAVGQVFNIGATEDIRIADLARKVLTLAHPPAHEPADARGDAKNAGKTETEGGIVFVPYETAYPSGFEDMMRRIPDISKIRKYTGWEPRRSLNQVLRDVISDFSRDREPAVLPW